MIWVILVIASIGLDQISKLAIVNKMGLGDSIPVIEKFFYITYWENKGAAWGLFQNGRFFFIGITFIVSLVIAYLLFKSKDKLLKFSLALILGGAIGNFIDRVYKGSVTDFLQVYIGSYEFPIFNVADSCVVVGTIILAYFLLFIYKEEEKVKKEE